MLKRLQLATLTVAASLVLVATDAAAQAFPTKPVHFIVPFAAGGAADVLARLLSERLSVRWGQPVLVDSKPGGGTVIGSGFVAKAAPDGHTILFISNSFVINPKLRKDLPYDGIRAFEPVANMVDSPQVVAVSAGSRFMTLADVVGDAKAKPGTFSIGTLGPATTQHIAAVMLQRATGTSLIYTPYTGGVPAMTAVMGGHIDLVLANLAEVGPHIASGKLRPLAMTSRERAPSLPQVPTVAELGTPGYEAIAWFGVAAPAGTPSEIVNKLAEGLRATLDEPEVRQRISAMSLQPAYLGPKAFAAHIQDQYLRYSKVIDEAGIRTD